MGGHYRRVVGKKETQFEELSRENYFIHENDWEWISYQEKEVEEIVYKKLCTHQLDFKKLGEKFNFDVKPIVASDIYCRVVKLNGQIQHEDFTNYYFGLIININKDNREIIMLDIKNDLENLDIVPHIKDNMVEISNIYSLPELSIKSGEYDIIFNHQVSGLFAHEIIGHLVERDNIEKYGGWKIGEKICNIKLTVIDDPGYLHFVGSYQFDDEGTKSKKTILLKEGKIVNELNNIVYNTIELNGNSRTTDPFKRPMVRMSNTYIQPRESDEEDIIRNFKKGIILDKAFHGGIDWENGLCFIQGQGRYIECGKGKGVVKNVVVCEKIEKILNKIETVGNKTIWSSGCWCKKDNQEPIPVKYGGPVLKLKDVWVIVRE
ncbi:MAG: hypothetical protein KAX49_19220 [Halanaerobiales bacterium]|nr:hypothetical protein [Halanaerobiales bacterium]